MEIKTVRVEIRYPIELLNEIDRYQKENLIQNRTVAILELIRKGLKSKQ